MGFSPYHRDLYRIGRNPSCAPWAAFSAGLPHCQRGHDAFLENPKYRTDITYGDGRDVYLMDYAVVKPRAIDRLLLPGSFYIGCGRKGGSKRTALHKLRVNAPAVKAGVTLQGDHFLRSLLRLEDIVHAAHYADPDFVRHSVIFQARLAADEMDTPFFEFLEQIQNGRAFNNQFHPFGIKADRAGRVIAFQK